MTRVAAARRHERPADNSRLVTEGISKIFGSVSAVDNVSLNIPAGQFVGIIGRSGAGKSTLLRMLNRLTDPTSGRIMCRAVRGNSSIAET
jgi:ABC-type multidrug transport system ATPase subunit